MDPLSKLFNSLGMLSDDIIKARDKARAKGEGQKVFNWKRAAEIINRYIEDGEDFTAIAGLTGDMKWTSGTIFEFIGGKGRAVTDSYTYLSSCHAIPCLVIRDLRGNEKGTFDCWVHEEGTEYRKDTKWPKADRKLLNLPEEKIASNPRFRLLDMSELSESPPPKMPKTKRFKNLE